MCRPSGRGKDRRLIPLIIDLSQSSPFLHVSLRRSWLASYTISVSREESFRYNNSASDSNFVGVLLLDMSKAFDTVSHQKLLNDLSSIGCGSAVINWFCSYLSHRSQRVRFHDSHTLWKVVSRESPREAVCHHSSLISLCETSLTTPNRTRYNLLTTRLAQKRIIPFKLLRRNFSTATWALRTSATPAGSC